MISAADQTLIDKQRLGQIITVEDHIATIDSMDALISITGQLIAANRLTDGCLEAIRRQQVRISANQSYGRR